MVRVGNFGDDARSNGSWVMGFNEHLKEPLQNKQFGLKWSELEAHQRREISAKNLKSSSLVVLVAGEMRLWFGEEKLEVVLKKQGDYVVWGAGVWHMWETVLDSVVMTLRWPAIQDDQREGIK
jgi:quercetin dioxygenase-like cupin family protein